MKVRENALAVACAAAFGLIWIICSVLVIILPTMMSNITGNMLHTDWNTMGWHISTFGVVIGGILWAFLAGILGWLVAKIYNMQLRG
ncbi:hypothetical protein CTH30272_00688 [Allocatenococcus thiocycli]|nr:hypothetical protein DBX26_25160 [Vibrio sp. dhg]CAH0525377.1 hypothetical protein CTH30272_00688 [Catenococcus thiocycli]